MAYFDYNATAPLRPVARAAWLEAADGLWSNPSSPYRAAARARNALEDARARIAAAIGCPAGRVVFTSGATEGNNAMLRHFAGRPAGVSAVEHPSVRDAVRDLPEGSVTRIPVDAAGRVRMAGVREWLDSVQGGALLSVMAANNETGTLQPWHELARLCRERGIAFHCDAVQWIGRMPLAGLADCAFVTASAHKFGGPKGVGFLLIPADARDFRAQRGGEQEDSHRGGTENLPSILAMAAALNAACMSIEGTASAGVDEERDTVSHGDSVKDSYSAGVSAPRDAFVRTVIATIPGTEWVGQGPGETTGCLWNTAMLIMPRHRNTRWVARLDRLGFEVSTGSACATGKQGPSHVLAAMGIAPERAQRAVRISSGWDTPAMAWTDLARAFTLVWEELEAEAGGSGAMVIEV